MQCYTNFFLQFCNFNVVNKIGKIIGHVFSTSAQINYFINFVYAPTIAHTTYAFIRLLILNKSSGLISRDMYRPAHVKNLQNSKYVLNDIKVK